ncbi:MAG: hypothetical protein U9R25_12265 [Chloroflexota bacterium]|nr:hypothetical protein [Chloroflexota bacterium]
MKTLRLISLTIALALLTTLAVAAGAPQPVTLTNGGCTSTGGYDPACDVDHNGIINVTDIQLTAGHWNESGTWVGDNNHNHLGQTWVGTNNPLRIEGSFGTPDYAALILNNSSGDGVRVYSAGDDGVEVGSAGDDGVYVGSVGSPTTTSNSSGKNGFEVAGAQHYGLFVGRADSTGVVVDSAGGSGVAVDSASDHGFYVGTAGTPAFANVSNSNNGFEVAGAEHFGLYVGRAGLAGVRVESAGTHGVYVESAGTHGVSVNSATLHGVNVNSATYGLHVGSADYGVRVTGSSYAGSFVGDIEVIGSCYGCLLATFGVNADDKPLAPGDIVSLAGLRESGVNSVPMLMEVQVATGSDAVVGVVQGWAELVTEEDPRPTEIGLRLVPRDGDARPGDYVTIAYSGLTQVKASGPVEEGSNLVAGESGSARAQRTVTVEGVELAENADVIGTALERLDADDGLIWALVNVQ